MKIIPHAARQAIGLCIVAGSLLLCTIAGAAGGSDEPIHIESDRLVSQENQNTVVFIGNVDVRQGDLVIRTDEMTVHHKEDKSGSGNKQSNDIEKLVCIGNVEITQGDWLGTGERMDYYAKDRKVILSGNAKGWQGQNMVSGKTITYYLDEGRSVVEGPTTATGKPGQEQGTKPGRVKAVIHPDADK